MLQFKNVSLSKTPGRDLAVVAISLIVWYLISGWLAFAIVVGYIIYKNVTEKKPKFDVQEYNKLIFNDFYALGATPEERDKVIKKIFNEKNRTIRFQWHWVHPEKYRDGQNNWRTDNNCFKRVVLKRNLASMEQREREFLRTAHLLFNEGKITESNFGYYMFAFVNGNGKAGIDGYNYNTYSDYTGVKDGPTTVKYIMDNWDATVDGAVNNLLHKIEALGVSDNNTGKALKEIKGRIHGDGAWLSEDEIEDSIFEDQPGQYSLCLGQLDDNEKILHYGGVGSLITIAPTRSGKTQCMVLPNMLSWKGAAVVLDVKGEIYDNTHKWREENVGKVYKFNPLDPNNSHSYNPLFFVRNEPDYIWEDSRLLASMMIVPSGASDPFWEDKAREALTATIAYVVYYNDDINDRTMSKVLDIMYGIGWDEMIVALKTNIQVASMRRSGNALGQLQDKQRDSVLATAQNSLNAWQGERISRVTDKSDWSPLDLRNGTPTIYICFDVEGIESYLSLLRVFIAQHIRMLFRELPKHGAAPILFMLDEFPQLQKMQPIEEALKVGAQYGIKLWMFTQNYGDLKKYYQDSAEGLVGNCAVRTFMNLPINEELTTKISDQLGYRQDALGNTKEKLVEPIELAGPNYRDTILVLATGTKPAKLKKRFAYADKELTAKMN